MSLSDAECLVYLCGVVDEKSSAVVNPLWRVWGEKESGGWARQEGGGKREGVMATRGELDRETGWSLEGSGHALCLVSFNSFFFF